MLENQAQMQNRLY